MVGFGGAHDGRDHRGLLQYGKGLYGATQEAEKAGVDRLGQLSGNSRPATAQRPASTSSLAPLE